MRILAAVVVANILVSLADWYFFGVLWHEKYNAHPEVWRRHGAGSGEGRAVAQSAVVGALTPTVFVLVSVLLGQVHLKQASLFGAAVWVMGPVPMWIWNYLFMKIHPLIVVAGILGWLVRLGLSAVVVALLVG